jgi:hypothetical protein
MILAWVGWASGAPIENTFGDIDLEPLMEQLAASTGYFRHSARAYPLEERAVLLGRSSPYHAKVILGRELQPGGRDGPVVALRVGQPCFGSCARGDYVPLTGSFGGIDLERHASQEAFDKEAARLGLEDRTVTWEAEFGTVTATLAMRQVGKSNSKVGDITFSVAPRKVPVVGVGLGIQKKGEVLGVRQVVSDGPAARAGLVAGDTIVEVDGVDIGPKTTAEAAGLLRGDAGSMVSVVLDDGRTLSIERAVVGERGGAPSRLAALGELCVSRGDGAPGRKHTWTACSVLAGKLAAGPEPEGSDRWARVRNRMLADLANALERPVDAAPHAIALRAWMENRIRTGQPPLVFQDELAALDDTLEDARWADEQLASAPDAQRVRFSTADGLCVEGDCLWGEGELEIGGALFAGSFELGHPVRGTLILEDGERAASFRGGLLQELSFEPEGYDGAKAVGEPTRTGWVWTMERDGEQYRAVASDWSVRPSFERRLRSGDVAEGVYVSPDALLLDDGRIGAWLGALEPDPRPDAFAVRCRQPGCLVVDQGDGHWTTVTRLDIDAIEPGSPVANDLVALLESTPPIPTRPAPLTLAKLMKNHASFGKARPVEEGDPLPAPIVPMLRRRKAEHSDLENALESALYDVVVKARQHAYLHGVHFERVADLADELATVHRRFVGGCHWGAQAGWAEICGGIEQAIAQKGARWSAGASKLRAAQDIEARQAAINELGGMLHPRLAQRLQEKVDAHLESMESNDSKPPGAGSQVFGYGSLVGE